MYLRRLSGRMCSQYLVNTKLGRCCRLRSNLFPLQPRGFGQFPRGVCSLTRTSKRGSVYCQRGLILVGHQAYVLPVSNFRNTKTRTGPQIKTFSCTAFVRNRTGKQKLFVRLRYETFRLLPSTMIFLSTTRLRFSYLKQSFADPL